MSPPCGMFNGRPLRCLSSIASIELALSANSESMFRKIIRGTRLTGGSASRKLTRGHSLDAYVHKLESQAYVHP